MRAPFGDTIGESLPASVKLRRVACRAWGTSDAETSCRANRGPSDCLGKKEIPVAGDEEFQEDMQGGNRPHVRYTHLERPRLRVVSLDGRRRGPSAVPSSNPALLASCRL